MSFTTPEGMAFEFGGMASMAPRHVGNLVIGTAALIQRDARRNTPVDTGFLRSSITRESRRSVTGAVSEVGPEANYGAYVENGTSRMAPQPYLLPAALQHEDTFLQGLEQLGQFGTTGSIGVSSALPSLFGAGSVPVEV